MYDEAKEWWQERIPLVTGLGNCKRCDSDDVHSLNTQKNYYDKCKHFGSPSPGKRGEEYYIENYNSHAEYLEEYRLQILCITTKYKPLFKNIFYLHNSIH